jgi:hypothetical protein
MKENTFNLKVDPLRSITLVLDSVFMIGVGLFLLFKNHNGNILLALGIVLILAGIVQSIRTIKTFHLDQNTLTVKRPLFPFKCVEEQFAIREIKEVKFNRINSGVGKTLTVRSNNKHGDFKIAVDNSKIDEFETELNKLGIKTIRLGM